MACMSVYLSTVRWMQTTEHALLIHGEVTHAEIGFSIVKHVLLLVMDPIRHFPELKIVLNTSPPKSGCMYIAKVAIVTSRRHRYPQHLMFSHNHMLVRRGSSPTCQYWKRNIHQQALREAVANGQGCFLPLAPTPAPHVRVCAKSSYRLCQCLQCRWQFRPMQPCLKSLMR